MPSLPKKLFLVEGTIVRYVNGTGNKEATWRLVEATSKEAAEDYFTQYVEDMSQLPRISYRTFNVKAHETLQAPDVPVTK